MKIVRPESSVGRKIKHRLSELGMSRRELYEKTGLSASAISKMSRGVTNVSIDAAKALSNVLGYSQDAWMESNKHIDRFKIDISGKKFGRWSVLARSQKRGADRDRMPYWACKCDCGVSRDVSQRGLLSGTSTSCGCYNRECRTFDDLTGKKFGRLTALRRNGKAKTGSLLWECECCCGAVKTIDGSSLKNGNTQSCGCLAIERTRQRSLTHGHTSNDKRSATYSSWQAMMARCYNPKNRMYRWYGARGIIVCDRWKIFGNFLLDMGERPLGKTIDRIDDAPVYCKENCRWATREQQDWNRSRVIYMTAYGETDRATEWAKISGLTLGQISSRLRLGWSGEEILSTPIRRSTK